MVVSRRRSVRKVLALALAEAGFEVLSLESAQSMPWLKDHLPVTPATEPVCETVFVDGEVGRALAVVDVLCAEGVACNVRIVAGTNLDGDGVDRNVA